MKPVGIVRRIDKLGRVGIPVAYMRQMGWIQSREDFTKKDFHVEIFATDENVLIIRPHPSSPSSKPLFAFDGVTVG